ncbi:hypothetical protein LOC70_24155 [Rhodopirellula sp. JC737]|nr:hypothetical protein [Rhodopirellula sp. JC737]
MVVGTASSVTSDDNWVMDYEAKVTWDSDDVHQAMFQNANERVRRWCEEIESESSFSRRSASENLVQYALLPHDEVSVSESRRLVLGHLRGLRTSMSLETRTMAVRATQRILIESHRQEVAAFEPRDDLARNWREHELVDHWDRFSKRAGEDREALACFRSLAMSAGPEWNWAQVRHRRGTEEAWLCRLGIETSDCEIRHSKLSQSIRGELRRSPVSIGDGCTPIERLVGRVIDATLLQNPYGWSVETRLEIALIHGRRSTVRSLCESSLRLGHATARETSLCLLAMDRVNDHELDVRLERSLDDRRVITVRAGEAHFGVRDRHWPQSIVVPRVQNVAQYLIWKREGIDARKHGITAIQADPVWGAKVESIGRCDVATR